MFEKIRKKWAEEAVDDIWLETIRRIHKLAEDEENKLTPNQIRFKHGFNPIEANSYISNFLVDPKKAYVSLERCNSKKYSDKDLLKMVTYVVLGYFALKGLTKPKNIVINYYLTR